MGAICLPFFFAIDMQFVFDSRPILPTSERSTLTDAGKHHY